jgi:hypothetical protein
MTEDTHREITVLVSTMSTHSKITTAPMTVKRPIPSSGSVEMSRNTPKLVKWLHSQAASLDDSPTRLQPSVDQDP